MADTKAGQEPSMEEILSSIRRIIAEDDAVAEPSAGGTRQVGGAATSPGATPSLDRTDEDEDDDVLELTEVAADPEPLPPPPPPKAKEPPAAVKPTPQPGPPAPAGAAPPRPANPTQENPSMPVEAAEALVSPVAASASTQALARLARAVATEEKKVPTGAGVTVEELLVDLLTPMLKDWLDKHLPEVVERVVEQEVKKLARRAELM
jgi:uncharacterized protein